MKMWPCPARFGLIAVSLLTFFSLSFSHYYHSVCLEEEKKEEEEGEEGEESKTTTKKNNMWHLI